MKPLEAVSVLDLTEGNPYIGSVFADYGATVLKVEKPQGGDDIRRRGGTPEEEGPYAQYYLRGKNPRLHTDEILIALSSSAATNELAAAALHQLPNLKGCDVHSTVLLSGVDTGTLNRLGMYLTCDPVYEEEDRKYHKQ